MKKRENAVHPPKTFPGLNDAFFWTFVFVCFMILGFCVNSCNPVEHFNDKADLEDDHLVEELTEYIIEHQTGIDVDLTPRSPE